MINMCENVESYCRICLDVESEHVPIFGDAAIHLHLKSCLAVTVSADDGLPKNICASCVSQLSDFYNFKLNAMFSQEWLESCIQNNSKKAELKSQPILPLPDSEYNSDSLLEFLNNTANIEEYLNNLGRDDIPSIVNMLDRNNENSMDDMNKAAKNMKVPIISPRKEVQVANEPKTCNINMEVDVLDSDIEIVNEILMKETEPKKLSHKIEKIQHKSLESLTVEKLNPNTQQCSEKQSVSSSIVLSECEQEKPQIETLESIKCLQEPMKCFACKSMHENAQKLSQHFSICDFAQRTCFQCLILFDSKHQMLKHSVTHNTGNSHKCNCGKQFYTKENLLHHHKVCKFDCTALGFIHRCKQCKQTFDDRSLLYHHVKEHILKADERICNICGHRFIGDEELAKHRLKFHGKADSNRLLYRCKVCCQTSPSHKELFNHVQKHLANEFSDRHLCDICGKTFKTRTILIRHSFTHKGANQGVKEKVELSESSHVKVPCKKENEEVKLCNGVKRPYSNGVKRPYSEVEAESNKCNICNTVFEDLNKRDLHVLQHIEMTVCEKCGECMTHYQIDRHLCG